MSQLLRDPIWQFLGFAITLVVTLLVSRFQNPKKGISYRVVSQSSKISVDKDIQGNLKIIFNDRPVRDLSVIEVDIFNSGNMPIRPDDFYNPLEITFGEATEIISMKSTPNPAQIKFKWQEYTSKRLVIEPLLLNKGDSIRFEFLLSGFDGLINVNGRVADVKQINRSSRPRNIASGVIHLFYTFIVVFVLIFATRYWYEHERYDYTFMMALTILFFAPSSVSLSLSAFRGGIEANVAPNKRREINSNTESLWMACIVLSGFLVTLLK